MARSAEYELSSSKRFPRYHAMHTMFIQASSERVSITKYSYGPSGVSISPALRL